MDSEESLEDVVTCDAPWELVHRSCMFFSGKTGIMTWEEARQECIIMHSDLLVISDVLELVIALTFTEIV